MNIIKKIATRIATATAKMLRFSIIPTKRNDVWFYAQIMGLYVGVGRWFGNCFSPAIVFEWKGVHKGDWSHSRAKRQIAICEAKSGVWATATDAFRLSHIQYQKGQLAARNRFNMPTWAILTIRTQYSLETKFYFRGWAGMDYNSDHIAVKLGEVSTQDFGDTYFYKGLLGTHTAC